MKNLIETRQIVDKFDKISLDLGHCKPLRQNGMYKDLLQF